MSKHNKPFETDYAKSNRASCKGCKTTITQGTLRLAVMVQSPFFDGKTPKWFHEKCFWAKNRPKAFLDIHNVSSLKHDDQELIKSKILGTESPADDGDADTPKSNSKAKAAKGKGKKRPNKEISNACNDFTIQYSLSNRAVCRGCQAKIAKDDIRVAKKNYESEQGRMLGGIDEWYHLACFAKLRTDLEFPHSGENIPGFDALSKSDREMTKKILPDMKSSSSNVKKEEADETDGPTMSKKAKTESSAAYKKQTDKLHKTLDIVKTMKRVDVDSLLDANQIQVPKNKGESQTLLADHLMFGLLKACPKCKGEGKYEMVPDEGYRCKNVYKADAKVGIDLSELAESAKRITCNFLTRDPDRVQFLIPNDYVEKYPALKAYKQKKGKKLEKKIFPEGSPSATTSSSGVSAPAGPSGIVKSEPGSSGIGAPLVQRHLPLKDMLFYIHVSAMSSAAAKQKLTKEIINLGGDVTSEIKTYLAAAIATKTAVDSVVGDDEMESKSSGKGVRAMETIEEMNIHVVPSKFVKDAAKVKPGDNAAELLEKMNLAPWASDLQSRIKMAGEEKLKSMEKSKSYKSKGGKVKLTVQDGLAVDPDSGLADTCELVKFGDKYLTAAMSKTDVAAGKNSYYKLQVLKSKIHKNKYHLFRSWGRIGTVIGGQKIQDYKSVDEAFEDFDEIFEKETGNSWLEPYTPIQGKMILLDVKYDGGVKKEAEVAADVKCTLDDAVQTLIKLLFDEKAMTATLAEYELDMDQMPLGKLTASHLSKGYTILTKIMEVLEKDSVSDSDRNDVIMHMTSAFYTCIPHSFGLQNPPLLDSKEMVIQKINMIDAMTQIDVAYTIKQASNESGVHPLMNCYEKLKADIKILDPSHEQYSLIQKYVSNTHAKTHRQYSLNILDVFQVSRVGEDKRFKPMAKLGNKQLLWHGSRLTNFASIISKGLCIAPPEAPVTGYMFGKGIYFADSVSKSANYCMTSSSNNVGLLLLCEVALGNVLKKTQAEFVTKLPAGYQSVQGQGRSVPKAEESIVIEKDLTVPLGTLADLPRDEAKNLSLLYNEFIVYDPAQVKIRYILKVKFDYL
uniref:Poly [ADP-ribose] polymerase n=1 Tax=Cacopsylla melanoneura TaxID=428564 RepID=A0A8D8YVJ1_9HEMI